MIHVSHWRDRKYSSNLWADSLPVVVQARPKRNTRQASMPKPSMWHTTWMPSTSDFTSKSLLEIERQKLSSR